MDADDHLDRLIAHRIDALAILALMLEFRLKWQEPKRMQILVDGKVQFEGLTSMFTNPIIEAGILHVRALLEFLGLTSSKAGRLATIQKRRYDDDAGIELLTDGTRSLCRLLPEQAVAAADHADAAQAEACLVAAINAADKGMAHHTTLYASDPVSAEQLLLAARLTQRLVEQHVYQPLRRSRPLIPIEGRKRPA